MPSILEEHPGNKENIPPRKHPKTSTEPQSDLLLGGNRSGKDEKSNPRSRTKLLPHESGQPGVVGRVQWRTYTRAGRLQEQLEANAIAEHLRHLRSSSSGKGQLHLSTGDDNLPDIKLAPSKLVPERDDGTQDGSSEEDSHHSGDESPDITEPDEASDSDTPLWRERHTYQPFRRAGHIRKNLPGNQQEFFEHEE